MPKRKPGDFEKQSSDAPRPESDVPSTGARPALRLWVVVLAAVAAILAGWSWGVRAYRMAAARDAIAALQPVAPSVPEDPPERREALEIADRLLRDYPDSPEALYVRGSLLSRYGFNDEAVQTWQASLVLFPDLAPIYELLGIDAFRRGENERAVELLRRAVQLDPQSANAGLCLGESLNRLGRMDEAIPALERYLEHAPESADAYFQLGQAYMYLQDYEQARECHQTALAKDPQYAQACFGLAMACERLGEADRAREYRERYTEMIARTRLLEQQRVRQNRDESEMEESLARAYATAGKIYLDHGREEEARELWERARAIRPRLKMPSGSAGR